MNEIELRHAANDAAFRVGQERIDYIHNSYPEEYWQQIEHIADKIDDFANIREQEA